MLFFFIGGIAPRTRTLRTLLGQRCPACAAPSTLRERRTDQVLSVFFIPLWTLRQGIPFLSCDNCGWTSGPSASLLEEREQQQQQPLPPPPPPPPSLPPFRQPPPQQQPHAGSPPPQPPHGLMCPTCMRPVQPDFAFCPSCGRAL
ncbi:hypothetical protein Agub_g11823 [Astrephomene gubernaculifera]|uniref:Zinc-ribbon 15 domain-containing protein n=1 Tax=Astrephomene gubernaculifera TaxID=47775 RepID=A0AAD3DX51_9CHLO|nr:hypothetical protein Agub_g11823 [Astrephomene gubernaculifera]